MWKLWPYVHNTCPTMLNIHKIASSFWFLLPSLASSSEIFVLAKKGEELSPTVF